MKKTKWIEMTKEERIEFLRGQVAGLMLQIEVLKEAIKKLQKDVKR